MDQGQQNRHAKLIGTINKHLDAPQLEESVLDSTFEKWWPNLEQKLAAMPPPSETLPPSRSTDDKIDELLELTRAVSPDLKVIVSEAKRARNIRQLAEYLTKNLSNEMRSGKGLLSDLASEGAVAGLGGFKYDPEPPPGDTPTEPSKPAVPLHRPRGADKK